MVKCGELTLEQEALKLCKKMNSSNKMNNTAIIMKINHEAMTIGPPAHLSSLCSELMVVAAAVWWRWWR